MFQYSLHPSDFRFQLVAACGDARLATLLPGMAARTPSRPPKLAVATVQKAVEAMSRPPSRIHHNIEGRLVNDMAVLHGKDVGIALGALAGLALAFDGARKHLMHVAAVLALLGSLAPAAAV